MKLKLLVTPLAKGAYFDDYLDVAQAELRACCPDASAQLEHIGGLDFVVTELDEAALPTVARLSFVQGAFAVGERDELTPIALRSDFLLPEAVVYGAKYQGKTNELVTQLAINIGLRNCATDRAHKALLDPMAGRGTTLLWSLRYGIDATGIERDPEAAAALHGHLKKQTKLHRIKHTYRKGRTGGSDGAAVAHYELAGHRLRFVTGDSRRAPELLGNQRFDLIVADLPYGVRFTGGPRRSPVEVIAACADGWLASLRDGGAMVLVFNDYQPSRAELTEVFARPGVRLVDFAAPHRMSESIVRDLFVLTRDASGAPAAS